MMQGDVAPPPVWRAACGSAAPLPYRQVKRADCWRADIEKASRQANYGRPIPAMQPSSGATVGSPQNTRIISRPQSCALAPCPTPGYSKK